MVDPGGITLLFRALGRSDLKCLFFHFPAFVIACVFSLPFVVFLLVVVVCVFFVCFLLFVFFCFVFVFASTCTCLEFASFSPLIKPPPKPKLH